MYLYWMLLLSALIGGQIVGMQKGWPLSRHIGSFTTRHWAIMGLLSGTVAWLYFHLIVAMIWSPGLTATVVILDLIVFMVFFLVGKAIWHIRAALMGEDLP
jgi:hypothetical protein